MSADEVGQSGEATVSASLQGFEQLREQGRVREILEDIRRGIQATVTLSEEGQRRTETGLSQVLRDVAQRMEVVASTYRV